MKRKTLCSQKMEKINYTIKIHHVVKEKLYFFPEFYMFVVFISFKNYNLLHFFPILKNMFFYLILYFLKGGSPSSMCLIPHQT